MHKTYILSGLLLIIIFAACETENCTSPQTNRVIFSMLNEEGGVNKNFYTFLITAEGTDSIYASAANDSTPLVIAESFVLPLNPIADTTEFLFLHIPYSVDTVIVNDQVTLDTIPSPSEWDGINSARWDTVNVIYQRRQRIVSQQCGVQQQYTLQEIESSFNDENLIEISVSIFNEKNIEIYH